ncbi:MAG: hypothetical protein MR346_05230 [Clostridium sp.]|nr:hypothetical protein [Clostridium sp.]
MSKYYDILNRIYKLENIIACNKVPIFESLVCYKSAGEFIKANSEDEIISILQDKIKRVLGISTSNLEDIFAAIGDDAHTENLQNVVNKIIANGNGEIPRKILYRGCSISEYNNILNYGTSKISRCLSFSESKDIASTFGKRLIAARFKFPIFPYYKLYKYYFLSLKKSLKEYEWKDFDDMTGAQYGIDLATRELEWIAPENTVFTLNDDGTFTATLEEPTGNSTKHDIKKHLKDLCDSLEIQDYNIDGYYRGKESCNIHIDSNEYSNKLISNNALSYLEEPEISIHYTYDSNTLEIFAVGLGTVKNIVNMASLNEDSFSRLVKNMIDSMV